MPRLWSNRRMRPSYKLRLVIFMVSGKARGRGSWRQSSVLPITTHGYNHVRLLGMFGRRQKARLTTPICHDIPTSYAGAPAPLVLQGVEKTDWLDRVGFSRGQPRSSLQALCPYMRRTATRSDVEEKPALARCAPDPHRNANVGNASTPSDTADRQAATRTTHKQTTR